MSETVTFDTRAFVAQIQKLDAEMGAKTLSDATYAGATVILQHAEISMAQPKHGRQYRRGKKMHTASAPGESPAMDTGALAKLKLKRLSATQQSAESACYSDMEYAARLELQMDRAFLRPAMDEGKAEIEAAIAVTLQRAINRAVPQ